MCWCLSSVLLECMGIPDASCLLLVQRRRGSKAEPITEDDVIRAIDKLKVLGGGFSIMKVDFFPVTSSWMYMSRAH